MEATAKYDYEASAEDELSFTRGEPLKILQMNGNWYKAELHGVQGFVPKNFIDIQLPSWYQEGLSRAEAQLKLLPQPVGAFFIRGSQSATPGDYSISVRQTLNVEHFKVLQDSRGRYHIWDETFSSLNRLVEHYQSHSVSRHSQIVLLDTQTQQRARLDSEPTLPSLRPPTPAPRQLPASSLQVVAMFNFVALETDELQFEAGDVITVLQRSDTKWWMGQLGERIGLFPSNYTKPV